MKEDKNFGDGPLSDITQRSVLNFLSIRDITSKYIYRKPPDFEYESSFPEDTRFSKPVSVHSRYKLQQEGRTMLSKKYFQSSIENNNYL
mgnify:CR=1 FL=1|jgi:hypothetical protein